MRRKLATIAGLLIVGAVRALVSWLFWSLVAVACVMLWLLTDT